MFFDKSRRFQWFHQEMHQNTPQKKCKKKGLPHYLMRQPLCDMVEMVGESRRQGRLTPPFRASLLDSGFPGVFSSLHPDTNPLILDVGSPPSFLCITKGAVALTTNKTAPKTKRHRQAITEFIIQLLLACVFHF